uniref:Uncharacterized protein n=3 Tax=Zea mays TaxID=4577 RepID=A0A804RB80_MAIZE
MQSSTNAKIRQLHVFDCLDVSLGQTRLNIGLSQACGIRPKGAFHASQAALGYRRALLVLEPDNSIHCALLALGFRRRLLSLSRLLSPSSFPASKLSRLLSPRALPRAPPTSKLSRLLSPACELSRLLSLAFELSRLLPLVVVTLLAGKFAMGSDEPLGKPTDIVDILDNGIEVTSKFVDCSNLTNKGKTVDKGTPGESNDNKPNLGKRKRFMTDEDVAVFNGMKEAVSDVAVAVRESIHAEAAPGIYNAVINCPGFSREALMYALNHMMEHKATSLVFLDMTPDDRDLWLKTFLAKHYHI